MALMAVSCAAQEYSDSQLRAEAETRVGLRGATREGWIEGVERDLTRGAILDAILRQGYGQVGKIEVFTRRAGMR